MKNNDLIPRYIYAVTKNLPTKNRKDVGDELYSIITDMLDERCHEATPTDKDIRIVLTELGTPEELEEKYNPDSRKCLIGGEYYTKYKLVTKIVLASVAFGLTLSSIITATTDQGVDFISFFSSIWSGLLSAFAFVTILFAYFYHKGVKINKDADNSIDNLPPVPSTSSIIPIWKPIVGIAFSIFFAIIFLAVPQVVCAILPKSGTVIPFFNIDALKESQIIIAAFTALAIARECVALIEGRYTLKLLIVATVTNLLSAILAFLWLSKDNLINPVVVREVTEVLATNHESLKYFLIIPKLFMGVIMFALIMDFGKAAIGYFKNR